MIQAGFLIHAPPPPVIPNESPEHGCLAVISGQPSDLSAAGVLEGIVGPEGAPVLEISACVNPHLTV